MYRDSRNVNSSVIISNRYYLLRFIVNLKKEDDNLIVGSLTQNIKTQVCGRNVKFLKRYLL